MDITSRDNLVVKVYVIGYSERGESIFIVFLDKGDNNKLLYSIVIDSFKYKGEHKTLDIMDNYGLKDRKVDMLVWSHPDYDHTYGLNEILNSYCCEETMVILPYDLNGAAWNKVNYNKEDKHLVDTILGLTKRKFLSHETISVIKDEPQPVKHLTFCDSFGNLGVQIDALSPHGSKINYKLENNVMIHKNDLSISLLISIGNKEARHKLLFLADTENDEIDMLYPIAFKQPLFTKIPHHSSSTSDHLSVMIKTSDSFPTRKPVLACTTIYKRQGLPEPDVVKQYKECFHQLDWTGTSKSQQKNYGYVEYTFDIYDKQSVEVKHHGHASVINDATMDEIKRTFVKKKVNSN